MTWVLIHGTLSALDKESSAFGAGDVCKKGGVVDINVLT
jgi:hypothetical protein